MATGYIVQFESREFLGVKEGKPEMVEKRREAKRYEDRYAAGNDAAQFEPLRYAVIEVD